MHGTSDYLELGMDDLYIMQDSSSIEMVHKLLSRSDMTGYLLQLAIEWSTIHVGIGRNILSPDYDLYNNLITWPWINNICNFSHDYEI